MPRMTIRTISFFITFESAQIRHRSSLKVTLIPAPARLGLSDTTTRAASALA